MVKTTVQVYDFANQLARSSRERGYNDIATRLDDAMHLGSSGLEIIGAIGKVLAEERERLKDVANDNDFQDVMEFINRAFGSQ